VPSIDRSEIATAMKAKGICSKYGLFLLISGGLMALATTIRPKANGVRLEPERISRADVRPGAGLMPGEERMSKQVKLASNMIMAATIEVTAKGNGSLRLGNLNLRIFDSHNDGQFFENGMLDVDFSDLDGDERSEVIISGIVCFTDESGDTVLRREALVFIYSLQADKTFKQIYRNTTLSLNPS
jgi:hypothetical protein